MRCLDQAITKLKLSSGNGLDRTRVHNPLPTQVKLQAQKPNQFANRPYADTAKQVFGQWEAT
ncbi:uncharacterized protein PHALS_02007 [Plasmopara halstedii]|uniref:Uncharacterized protein n=1 Tax=Plasmopara halstedii TaxID=4781 RepID=A0A0P1ATN8_PLAHL|nr:uncharacterized protein PHALS_02007 [Plasmopara halstedii]CEG45726.1 hypothetical protein PHALS_02007 [Plasmopara halstedii]|eukprot:XP_024582095.1 hypothetical protein PHALS_02007 [Plasmopara halstedii]